MTTMTKAAQYAPRPVQLVLWTLTAFVGAVLVFELMRAHGILVIAAAVLTLGFAAEQIDGYLAWRREQRLADEERRTLSDRRAGLRLDGAA